jgi:hypothetical protein
MAGQVISIVPPRVFDFSGVDIGQSNTQILQSSVDVSAWSEAALMVRLIDKNLLGGYLEFSAHIAAPSDDYPADDFVSPDSAAYLYIDGGYTAPFLYTAPVSGPLGSALRVVVRATRTSANPMTAAFTADLRVTNHFQL